MKLIEALKQIKDLERKKDDLKEKVKKYCAHMTIETPAYLDQKRQVREWIQAHSDILKEILRLRVAIQKSNIATDVTIEIDGKAITKNIASWIHRRRDLAKEESAMWQCLSDKGLKEGRIQKSDGSIEEIKIVRCYDQEEKDRALSVYDSEPLLIDAKLEITNAITDLIE